MDPGSATARIQADPEIWLKVEQALGDPEMIDQGDPLPSSQAVLTLKRVITETQNILASPIAHPQIEFFEGSIRLIWMKPHKNLRLVIASRDDRPSYLYHEDVKDGHAANYEKVEPTPSNLAYWLNALESPGSSATR
ncbi:MAG: hypothetical protein WB992_21670 [Bryobacteraceae bacterium]